MALAIGLATAALGAPLTVPPGLGEAIADGEDASYQSLYPNTEVSAKLWQQARRHPCALVGPQRRMVAQHG